MATAVRAGGLAPAKPTRQQAILELVAGAEIGSQEELVEQLRARGFSVTQATVSRDIAELGLAKVSRLDRHVYVAPRDLSEGPAPAAAADPSWREARLRRILADVPVSIGRSGLTLVLVGTPGTASVVAQAIDDSDLAEQEGTLAGDNTLLVLFRDEARLERWLRRFRDLQGLADAAADEPDGPPTARTDPRATITNTREARP